MKVFSGNAVSIGYAIGPALVLKKADFKITKDKTENSEREKELFKQALSKAVADLEAMKTKSFEQGRKASGEILEAHLMLLADPEVQDQTEQKISNGDSAEKAYFEVTEEFRKMFLQMDDHYLQQRALDIQDIRQRVLFYIQNPSKSYPDLNLLAPTIVVADDLTPSQILSMERKNILGLVTVEGSGTSHTAILARSLEIPSLAGMPAEILSLKTGNEIFLDAEKGRLLVDIDESEKKSFLQSRSQYEAKLKSLTQLRGQKTKTKDGVEIRLAANISGPQDLESLEKNDAEAVGLYRTEFLFLDRAQAPSEEEQYEVYRQVFVGLKGRHILVRTLDIGGDKVADYLKMKKEENPFLGVRALRLCFQRPEIFRTQLRALLRAGHDARWGLMFPMVSQLEELLRAKSLLEEVKAELKREKTPYSENFEIGIMVEIPSVAWMIDVFAPHVDFVSLGTNDLLQYTCAADRLNPDLKSIYNPFNIGFLRQVHHVLKTCRETKVHAGICGSLSHHPLLMPFFIGCGVEELSMTSQHVLSTRESIGKLDSARCRALVEQVLSCSTTAEVQQICKDL